MNKHSLFLLLVSSLLAGIIGFAWARSRGTTSTVQFSYMVVPARTPVPAGVYGYDGYYALQAADVIVKTITAQLAAPETVALALRGASQQVPVDARQLSSVVTAVQTAPQFIQVTVAAASPGAAQAIAQALQSQASSFEAAQHVALQATPSVAGTHGLRTGLIGIATFLFTFFAGGNILLALTAFNDRRH
jgi:hypothetical protein